ncbi:MAG TPA: LPS assembly protein LptD [Candidatus Acidoferrales bacterium]|nr:LPS assembly protein LptD [Candidatus Acidoferrales bacterium]
MAKDRARKSTQRSSARFLIALFCFGVALAGRDARAQQEPLARKEEAPVTIDADSIKVDQRTETIEAQGNVEIRREDMFLKADRVRFDRKTEVAEAEGNVSIDHTDGWLKGDSVLFNLADETGRVERGEIFLDRNHLSLTGERFEKFVGQVYHIDRGFFTTCLCDSGRPTWRISGREIDVEYGGEGVVKDGTFYLFDYPVLYLPYAVFPVRTERQTGFLFPKFGYSNKEGFLYQQPFFWAVSPSIDVTIAPHIETNARAGLLGEYRQVFSRRTDVATSFAYFNERLRSSQDIGIHGAIADPQVPQDRWNFFLTHRQGSPAGWMTYSDIDVFSDDVFTRELLHAVDRPGANERLLKTARFGTSRLGLLRHWEDTQLGGEFAYYQDFIQPDRATFQRTPDVIFRGSRFLAGGLPVEFRWRAQGINYIRRQGADGLRVDLRPEIFLPLRAAPYLFGSFSIAPRETLYYLYSRRNLFHEARPFDRTNSRELFEVRGRLGTSLARVFSASVLELKEFKHIVEPELQYLFIPGTSQRDIPIMDDTDRINRRNLITFSVTNRFWGKFAREPLRLPEQPEVELLEEPPAEELREMGRVVFALGYDIDKERKGGDTLTDLDTRLVLTPLSYLNLGLLIGVNPGPWQVRQAMATVGISDPRPIMRRFLDPDFMRPSSIDVSYRFIRRNFLSPLGDNANLATLPPEREINRDAVGSLGLNVFLRLTDHLLFRFSSNYDARDHRFTSNRVAAKILSQCECWSVAFSVGRSVNPDRTRFEFQFSLLGLGSTNTGFGSGLVGLGGELRRAPAF